MKRNYEATMFCCFAGYVVQAIINNFLPLLFINFQSEFSIPLSKITLLVTFNFCMQLLIDIVAAKYVDRLGYRSCIIAAHAFAAAGLLLLTVLPSVMDPFLGILISVLVYSVGGGIIEVLISPIMEACPTKNKEKAMSLLHSFYCWGHVAVVLLSTVFFKAFGISAWRYMAMVWAAVPIINGVLFALCPIEKPIEEGTEGMGLRELFKNRMFLLLLLMMLAAGSSEQAVSQWASAFAEKGLGISKTAGDLAGPMAFAILMGSSRAIYGKFGDKIDLKKFMLGSCGLCILSYIMAGALASPLLNLLGCALCGFSVGILWPGTFSTATASLPRGGTAMFAMLALAGDLGCSGGPTFVGLISSATRDMKTGILAAIICPILMTACILLHKRLSRE